MRPTLHALDARVGHVLTVAEVDVRRPPERGEAEPDLGAVHAHSVGRLGFSRAQPPGRVAGDWRRRHRRRRGLGCSAEGVRRGARRPGGPRRGYERPLPRPAALGGPLCGQGLGGRGGVRCRERDPAACDPRLHRGHRRALRDHPGGRPRLRRRVHGRLSRHRAARRGDRRGRGAAPRAATQPGDAARVRCARRVDRRLEDRLVIRPRRIRARCSHPALSPRARPASRQRRRLGCARAQRAHRRGARHRRGLHDQRLRGVGGADRADGGDRGRGRGARQGDHDRHEPPAGEHGDQPLHDAGRRRHPRARSVPSA